MKTVLAHAVLAVVLGTATLAAAAADRVTITVSNPLPDARPGEVIVVPFSEIRRALPQAQMHHLVLKNAAGVVVPYQVTNFTPENPATPYDDLVFQHDFAAGEARAAFTLEMSEAPVPPFPTLVFARHVPERYDDFAWENDRIAHRMYGPALDSPAAGPNRMISSGIDVWAKRVPYPIVDRWYNKGHNAYHSDTGEGMDLYSVGTARGCGGVGVWDGAKLHTSGNWATARVLANGPIRAVFELGYRPWDAGGMPVSETKRFTVDAGRNLDSIESTFVFEGAPGAATIAIGIAKPKDARVISVVRNEADRSLALWQQYDGKGALGCGIVLAPDVVFAGFAEDEANFLILAKATSGRPLRYYAGAGWDRSGQFADANAWTAHLAQFATRLRAPVTAALAVSASSD